MFDADEDVGGNGLRILWMILCGFGIVLLSGVITGFLSAHMEAGGSALKMADYAILATLISVT